MFRGKESSNRIELSRLVQDLLNFGVSGSLQLLGGGRWMGGIWGHGGCPHTHAHACLCTHMHTRTFIHVQKLQMAANMETSMFSMFNMHVCVCVCMHACMHGTPPTHPCPPPPPSTHPPPPQGSTPRIT